MAGKQKQPETAVSAISRGPSPAAILQVKTWVVDGRQAADILQSIKAEFPKERPDVLLSAALAEIGTEAESIDTDLARGFLLNAYRELYRRALEADDFSNAISALRSFERVTGC
jgi:hypothetical protein